MSIQYKYFTQSSGQGNFFSFILVVSLSTFILNFKNKGWATYAKKKKEKEIISQLLQRAMKKKMVTVVCRVQTIKRSLAHDDERPKFDLVD